jgi:hypothetical protein
MNFLSQIFTFKKYYLMFTKLFDNIGYDYYKGLKSRLPPIRYIGKNNLDEELILIAHPKDFISKIKFLKTIYNSISVEQSQKINIEYKKSEVYEIYPSIDELIKIPNGFVALFVNDIGMNIINDEFLKNEEINSLKFIKITSNTLILDDINISGVLNIFINKLNKNFLKKFNNLYLVIGELNNINIKLGKCYPTNIYNIFGGKRLYDENSLQATIRECIEELGFKKKSKMINIIETLLSITNNIIKCKTFNVYCIYFTPYYYNNYDFHIKKKSLININQI